jgi:hypothetical protein
VRVRDRVADGQQQAQPVGDSESAGSRVPVDRLAIDVFHDEERPIVGAGAAIQQSRDVRVLE